jgi:hypothetical protein
MKKIAFVILLAVLTIKLPAQYNYFNFTSTPLGNPAFTSTGNGLVFSQTNELYFKSSYGYMGLAYVNGNTWSQTIIWGTQAPKATSQFVAGDSKVFYVDENSRLRELFWTGGSWANGDLNSNAPAARGDGLVFAGSSTLYYTTTSGSICKIYNNGPPFWDWSYENITNAPNAFNGSPLVFGDGKVFYIDNGINNNGVNKKLRELYKVGSTWQNGLLNTNLPEGRGDGLAFGTNSNLFYTTIMGEICNVFYSSGWNFNTLSSAIKTKSGSKILSDNNTLYYVGTDNYFYTLIWDNCDWYNKKIDKTVVPKPEAICWGNNQIFFRNNSDNVVYNSKTKTSTSHPFTYLKGKTFYNGTTPFYPVCMNYCLNLNTAYDLKSNQNAAVPDLWIGPSKDTYPWAIPPWTNPNNFNQAYGDAEISADFQNIKNLGFNCIRMGVPGFCNVNGPQDLRFKILSYHPSVNDWCQKIYNPTIDPNFKDALFDKIKHVLDLAQDEGLKVILLTGDYFIYRADYSSTYGTAYQNYGSYLNDLSSYSDIKNHEALIAYDLTNEAGSRWRELNNTKDQNCLQSAYWYDQIRNNDLNHLITLSLFGRADMFSWDPNILSVDFHSFHVYHWRDLDNLPLNEDGILAELNWIKKNIRTPWMIGEMTYSAIDNINYSCAGNTLNGWGTEQDQKTFAQFSQNAVRNAGGSGYSWWAYRDVSPGNDQSFQGVYSICGRAKPVTTEFNENTHNWLGVSCMNLNSSSHLKTYNYDLNTSYTYTIQGRLLDASNNPIPDGYIAATDNAPPVGNDPGQHGEDTFSKSDGTFKLCINSSTYTHRLYCTALGKEVYTYLGFYYTPGITNLGDIVLADIFPGGCSISNNVKTMATTIDEKEELNSLEIYPNPSKDHLMIKHNFTGDFTVEMHDMLGRELFSQKYSAENTEVKINYNDRISANNIVIVKISNGTNVITKKVIIVN